MKGRSGRKFRLSKDIHQKIENILSYDNDLEVNEIKDELEKKGLERNSNTLTIYLNKIVYEHIQSIDDLMNLNVWQMEIR